MMPPLRAFSLVFPLVCASLVLTACGGDDPDTSPSGTQNTSGGGGAGGEGSGGAGGAGGGVDPGSAPITAPNEQWTWVPIDGALCANGTPTGIGVNLTDKSQNVAIYMEGGGACWDANTCYVLKVAANLSGYDETKFQKLAGSLSSNLFDRSDPENPTRDYNFVYVPYCTGDIHAGSAEQDYGGKKTKHVGWTNFTLALKRLVPTFSGATRVILSGSSAGGFGAGFNWWRTVDAFPKARVDMIDDSGTALSDPYLSKAKEATWRAAWNLDAAMPPACTDCKNSLTALLDYYMTNFTKQRGALLSYTQDTVLSPFFGISTTAFEDGLKQITMQYEGKEGFRYFYVAGANHVLLSDPGLKGKSGLTLKEWLIQMISDDPKWSNDNPWTP